MLSVANSFEGLASSSRCHSDYIGFGGVDFFLFSCYWAWTGECFCMFWHWRSDSWIEVLVAQTLLRPDDGNLSSPQRNGCELEIEFHLWPALWADALNVCCPWPKEPRTTYPRKTPNPVKLYFNKHSHPKPPNRWRCSSCVLYDPL